MPPPNSPHSGIPIIVVTGQLDADCVDGDGNINAIPQMPFAGSELIDAVNELLPMHTPFAHEHPTLRSILKLSSSGESARLKTGTNPPFRGFGYKGGALFHIGGFVGNSKSCSLTYRKKRVFQSVTFKPRICFLYIGRRPDFMSVAPE